jgi:hypothetical protein
VHGAGEEGAVPAQELGPTTALSSCIPTGMHRPTCTFLAKAANLTRFPAAGLGAGVGRAA